MDERQKRKFNKFKRNLNVLLIANHDWCALGEQYARSLRSIGVNATMFIRKKHKLNYPNQGTQFKNNKQILTHVKNATIVHFMHSQRSIPKISLAGKKVVVSHTGSAYRINYAELNKIFNPIVDLTIVGGDLFGKGAKNEHYIPGGIVDTEKLKPFYKRTSNKIIIGHFPSDYKATEGNKIANIMKGVKGNFKFIYDPTRVGWIEQIKRMSECDIYIERLTGINGFGMTALEAASLGKILFTPYEFETKYNEALGDFAPIIFKSGGKNLVEKAEEFISLPDDELLKMKKKSRAWVEKNHSYKAVGMRFLELYKSIL